MIIEQIEYEIMCRNDANLSELILSCFEEDIGRWLQRKGLHHVIASLANLPQSLHAFTRLPYVREELCKPEHTTIFSWVVQREITDFMLTLRGFGNAEPHDNFEFLFNEDIFNLIKIILRENSLLRDNIVYLVLEMLRVLQEVHGMAITNQRSSMLAYCSIACLAIPEIYDELVRNDYQLGLAYLRPTLAEAALFNSRNSLPDVNMPFLQLYTQRVLVEDVGFYVNELRSIEPDKMFQILINLPDAQLSAALGHLRGSPANIGIYFLLCSGYIMTPNSYIEKDRAIYDLTRISNKLEHIRWIKLHYSTNAASKEELDLLINQNLLLEFIGPGQDLMARLTEFESQYQDILEPPSIAEPPRTRMRMTRG